MKRLTSITITLALLAPAMAFAAEGKIVEHKPACGYFLIVAAKGYLFVKQQGHGIDSSKKGDVIEGVNLGNFGISSLHNISTDETLWVFNANSWLSQDDATSKYVEKCGPIETHPIKDIINKVENLIPSL